MLWAARPPHSLSGSLGQAPHHTHAQTCSDILCHTPHCRHKQPACWLTPTALYLLASPWLPCSQPHPHPVCRCVCLPSSSACRMLCCLLVSLGFAQTHMHSLIISLLWVSFTHTHTHTHTPLLLNCCFSAACLLVFPSLQSAHNSGSQRTPGILKGPRRFLLLFSSSLLSSQAHPARLQGWAGPLLEVTSLGAGEWLCGWGQAGLGRDLFALDSFL